MKGLLACILDPFENLDPSTWPISLVTDGSLNSQKGSKKSDRSHILRQHQVAYERERESERAGGYSLIPGICINAFFHGAFQGFVSLADFVAFYSHRKSLRMDLFWQPQFRKQKWGGGRVVGTSLLPCCHGCWCGEWAQQQALCTSREECNKYDLTIAQYFWFVHHNDSSKWFAI